jgi:uncharacterized membrane protein
MIQIFFLTALVAILDSLFLFLTQKYAGIYNDILPQESMKSILYIFLCWFCIGMSIYFFIVSRSDFSFLTVLKTAPVIGLSIYGIYSLSNYLINPEKWSLAFVGIDIFRGILIITITSVIFSFFRKSFTTSPSSTTTKT